MGKRRVDDIFTNDDFAFDPAAESAPVVKAETEAEAAEEPEVIENLEVVDQPETQAEPPAAEESRMAVEPQVVTNKKTAAWKPSRRDDGLVSEGDLDAVFGIPPADAVADTFVAPPAAPAVEPALDTAHETLRNATRVHIGSLLEQAPSQEHPPERERHDDATALPETLITPTPVKAPEHPSTHPRTAVSTQTSAEPAAPPAPPKPRTGIKKWVWALTAVGAIAGIGVSAVRYFIRAQRQAFRTTCDFDFRPPNNVDVYNCRGSKAKDLVSQGVERNSYRFSITLVPKLLDDPDSDETVVCNNVLVRRPTEIKEQPLEKRVPVVCDWE